MSRVAKSPIKLPAGVTVTSANGVVSIKGAKASLDHTLGQGITVDVADGVLSVSSAAIKAHSALAGTTRAILNNMVTGVTKGYEIKLQLVGVGYRAAMQGKALNLQAGFSHPVNIDVPTGVTVETPVPTEIIIKGADKHVVGQLAAVIRAKRPPEPYKGKGVRYSTEKVVLKEAKKK